MEILIHQFEIDETIWGDLPELIKQLIVGRNEAPYLGHFTPTWSNTSTRATAKRCLSWSYPNTCWACFTLYESISVANSMSCPGHSVVTSNNIALIHRARPVARPQNRTLYSYSDIAVGCPHQQHSNQAFTSGGSWVSPQIKFLAKTVPNRA